MPRKHRDNSKKINLERNLGSSGSEVPMDDFSLWQEAPGRPAEPLRRKPIADVELERDVDHAAKVYVRKKPGEAHSMARHGFSGIGPKGYRRPDHRIQEEASEVLYFNHNIDASEIEVEVREGCVYLSGEVDSRQTKKMAEAALDGIKGVLDVQNRLKLKNQGSQGERNVSFS